MKNKPILSVIIPTHNEEKDISEAIQSLKSQSLKNIEIIIVDDGSTDNTKRIVSKWREIKILAQNHLGPGAARNKGARVAKGEFLVFVDADMTFHKDYLKNLIQPMLKNKKTIGTTHDYEVVKNTENIWSRCWGKIRVSKENAGQVKIFRAIRKKDFIKLGGFDSNYGYADDQTFWFKYGIKPVVAKNTTCYHKNPEKLRSVFRQSAWIGSSIDNKPLNTPIISKTIPIILIILSPLAIPLISIKKIIQFKQIKLVFAMFIFITVRYFGTIKGLINKIYLDKNFR